MARPQRAFAAKPANSLPTLDSHIPQYVGYAGIFLPAEDGLTTIVFVYAGEKRRGMAEEGQGSVWKVFKQALIKRSNHKTIGAFLSGPLGMMAFLVPAAVQKRFLARETAV